MKKIIKYIKNLSFGERIEYLIELSVVCSFMLFNIINLFFPYTDTIKLNLVFFGITVISGVNFYNNHNQKNNNQLEIGNRGDIEKASPLTEMWKDAKHIDVAAVSCISFAMRERALFEQCLQNKVNFRLVVMNPDSPAYKEHFSYKLKAPESQSYLEPSQKAISSLVDSAQRQNANFKSKLTDINLPYSIMVVEKTNPKESFIKIDIYSVDVATKDRPCIIIPRTEFKKYDFFKSQFNSIWESATAYPTTSD